VRTSSTAAVKRRQTIPVYRACSISAREFFRLLHRQPSSDFHFPTSGSTLTQGFERWRPLHALPPPTSDFRPGGSGILPQTVLRASCPPLPFRVTSRPSRLESLLFNPQSSIINPQSSIFNLQSSIINHQSSISSASLGVLGALAFQNLPLQSSILNPQSSISSSYSSLGVLGALAVKNS
jgi:hypothetical protein